MTANTSKLPINIFLTIVLLSSPCLLISFLLTEFGINLTQARVLILSILFLIALYSLKDATFIPTQKTLLLYYLIILIYLGAIWNFEILGSGSPRAVFRAILVGPLLLIIMNSKRFDIKNFTNFFIAVAFILSGLSIIQYFGVQIGLVPLKPTTLRWSLGDNYVGIGGYFSFRKHITCIPGLQYRNMGFFSEPTNFAQFLLVPLFLSMYKYFHSKKLLNLIMLSTISLAFILTFSVANYFGFFFGLTMFFCLKLNNPHFLKGLYNIKIISILSVLLVGFGIYSFYKITDQYSRSELIIGKHTSANIMNRLGRNAIYFERMLDYPLGDINFKHVYTQNTGFWGHVGIAGGFPLILIMFCFLLSFLSSMFKRMRKSKYLLIYAGLIAYLIPAMWDVKFYEAYFLFLIAFFSVFVKYDMNKKLVLGD